MSLELIRTNPNISISYDRQNNWLYLDWHGEQTLDSVRAGSVLIAQCFLERAYARVLLDNTNVTTISSEVFERLAADFLPYLHVAQVEYLAWVYMPDMDAQFYLNITLYKPQSPVIALFEDLASAYGWLRDVTFKTAPAPTQIVGQSRAALEDRIAAGFKPLDNTKL